MSGKTPISTLEEEERRARTRLAAFRAKQFHGGSSSPMAVDIRLRELERKWKGADDRLRRARHEKHEPA